MEATQKYMQRCIDLASQGLGRVAPNPMVGCVIVYENNIIGEGYHSFFGGLHAEVAAINSVKDKSLLPHSTLFVNLEPCNHHGKTPPCTDLIIKFGIKKVFVGSPDPNPLVASKGIGRLRKSGCSVEIGVLNEECKELNKRFFTFHEKKRPYIILKWAESANGFIDFERPPTSKPAMITSEKLRVLVHKWRSEEQAIMVGSNTALYDNPRLDVRNWTGNQPIRIVIDRELKIPATSNLLDNNLETLVINQILEGKKQRTQYIKMPFVANRLNLDDFMFVMHGKGIQSIFVEGGEKILQSLINQGLWDEARIFRGEQIFKSGTKAPLIGVEPQCNQEFLNETLSWVINQ